MLLTRVDADDIIGMTVIFDTVKALTLRLMNLTEESGEDLLFAKKYYSMHVVLLELIIHMQNGYMGHIDDKYLPKLQTITKQTLKIRNQARTELKREKSAQRRKIYKSNVAAHQLTLQTAKLYGKALKSQKGKVKKAQKKSKRDLALANNTLATVMVSADLLGMLKTSQQTFNALINLQVPELVPFKNLKMQKKFEELSGMIGN